MSESPKAWRGNAESSFHTPQGRLPALYVHTPQKLCYTPQSQGPAVAGGASVDSSSYRGLGLQEMKWPRFTNGEPNTSIKSERGLSGAEASGEGLETFRGGRFWITANEQVTAPC